MRRILSILIFSFLLLIVYSRFTIYKSYVIQKGLLTDFNTGSKLVTLSNIESSFINYNFPNLGATGLPVKTQVSRYYFKEGDFKMAFKLLDSSRNESPYSRFNEAQYADYYFQLGKNDSAVYYSKIAFEGIPNNLLHFRLYLKSLASEGDIKGIIKAFERIKDNEIYYFWESFLGAMYQFREEYDMTSYIEETRNLFSNQKNINTESIFYLCNIIEYGEKEFTLITEKINKADLYFNEKKYDEAIKLYTSILESSLENNFDLTYNIGICFFSLKNFKEALNYFDKSIVLKPNSSKAFFFNALTKNELNFEKQIICNLILKAENLGYNKKEIAKALNIVDCPK